ncbi:G protein-coupled receptor-like protein [Finch poxvirus]|uniref:G protein-coupled receptor-like protein n=2 Tax=unclassified Avipoxvirus TaxID=336487 RepID=A0AAT9URB3_9POXV|nr:G protein-coupled receptor-like protein [Finch poxvirus]UOX38919.1 G protein-coupled receptor-like protein [Finch poxvirus]
MEYNSTSTLRVLPSYIVSMITIYIYAISFAVGILGNCAVIWLVGFKWSRSITGLWFLNLAVADIILVLFLPVEVSYIARNYYWLFGLDMCKISSFTYHTGALASVFFLTVIGLDRYLMIYKKELCFKYRFYSYARALSIVLWVFAITLASIRAYSRTVQQMVNGIDCIDDFHDDENISMLLSRIVSWLFLIIGYIIPCVLLLSSYRAIICNDTKQLKTRKYLIAILIIAFLICWTPYNIICFLRVIGQLHDESKLLVSLNTIFIALTFLNSCFNPVIYTMLSKTLGIDNDVILEVLKTTLNKENEDEEIKVRYVR